MAAGQRTAVRPQERKTRGWLFSLLLLFFYPLLSYFSYFGIFILGYLLLAILILWVRDGLRGRKRGIFRFFSWRLLAALIVLSLGYIVFEYRLFGRNAVSQCGDHAGEHGGG